VHHVADELADEHAQSAEFSAQNAKPKPLQSLAGKCM
jgi:hypothetical protein